MEKISEKNKKFYILILLLLLISVLAFSVSFYTNSKKVLDVKTLNMSLTIGNVSGFDVSKDRLGFGELTSGNKATREDVSVENPFDFPIKVYFTTEGNITPFINHTKELNLDPGEKGRFLASTIVISNETQGDYTGVLIIIFKKA